MNPFDLPNFIKGKKLPKSKDLAFDEAYADLVTPSELVPEDERIYPNYRLLEFMLIAVFAILAARIAFLQIVRGEDYRSLAEGNKLRIQYVQAPRGVILDQNNKTIAGNIPSFELVVVPALLPQDPQVLDQKLIEVARIVGKTQEEIAEIILNMEKGSAYQTLLNLPKDQALILITKGSSLPGFVVQNSSIREYKDASIFAHLIGYTGKITQKELSEDQQDEYLLNDYIGKTGLEYEYEFFLRGVAGQRQTEIDARGEFIDDLPEIPATPGNNLKLNIDYDLQKVIFDSLNKILTRGRAKKAAAVVTDPKTGKVLALLSLPSFDSNLFAQGISIDEYRNLSTDQNNPLLNRAIAGTYPPGSTVKPMLAIAALSEGTITTQTKILDDGVIRVGNFSFYGYDRKGLGLMDVYSAIARSSDIFFYTVGGGSAKSSVQGLGPEKLAEWYRKFHLGTKLGIDLPSEKDGLVPDPQWKLATKKEQWFLGNTYHYSIGQGDLLVTPLQVNSWTATIANGGTIMQPYILDQVTDIKGQTIYENKPKVLKESFLDPQWVKVSRDGMRQAVISGSARPLNTLPIEIAGKTGTAQFDARNLNLTHAWFTSYAPANDPKIALTILVESGGEGSSVAVPVAKEVYQWWAENRAR